MKDILIGCLTWYFSMYSQIFDHSQDFLYLSSCVDLICSILPKLKAEADIHAGTNQSSAKKATVDTHRGGEKGAYNCPCRSINFQLETYQFCYFIRKTEPHSVILKARLTLASCPTRLKILFLSDSKFRGGSSEEINDASPSLSIRIKARGVKKESCS